jgi:hypothetical protein
MGVVRLPATEPLQQQPSPQVPNRREPERIGKSALRTNRGRELGIFREPDLVAQPFEAHALDLERMTERVAIDADPGGDPKTRRARMQRQ